MAISIKLGQTVNSRFRVLDKLGEGGFGTVFRAFDQNLSRDVALKILKPDSHKSEEDMLRFRRESRLLAQLCHKNIMSVYAIDLFDDGSALMVMEYLEGSDLRKVLTEAGSGLDYQRYGAIGRQLCSGLSHAHKQDIVHRDLNPANIVLAGKDEPTVKIIDFGLARLLDGDKPAGATRVRTLTLTGMLVGNPAYMSPEQCRGERLDARSDIYSLGCVLYEMMTGNKAFDSDNPVGYLHLQQNEYPLEPHPHWGNTELEKKHKNIVLCCLQKDRSKRFQSVDEISNLLEDDACMGPAAEDGLFERLQPWAVPAARKHALSRSTGLRAVVAVALVLSGSAALTAAYLKYTNWTNSRELQAESARFLRRRSEASNYMLAAHAFSTQGDYRKSAFACNQAIKLNPKDPDAYMARGAVYDKLGQPEKAIEDFTTAMTLSPPGFRCYYHRAIAYRNAGKYRQAIDDLSKAIEMDPQSAVFYAERGAAYENLGDHQKAIDEENRAIALDSKSATAYNSRGWFYYRLGKMQKALADYNQSIRLDPKNMLAYNNRAILYEKMNKNDLAEKDRATARALTGTNENSK
jgi:serine/threonine protein kinase